VAEPSRASVRAWERHLGEVENAAAWSAGLARGSLSRAFAEGARRDPARAALVIGPRRLTHGELDEQAARAAGWLRAHGVHTGDRVLLAGTTSIELVVAYLAILRAGAAMVPAAPASTRDELAHLVADAEPAAAFAAPEADAALSGVERVIALGDVLGPLQDGEPLPPDGEPEDLAMLAYTSGTTGRPKGVPLTHGNLLASLRAAMAAWRWQARDVLVHALPLSHQHGLSGVQMALLGGSTAALLEHFDPTELAATIERVRGTVLFAVPAMYERLDLEEAGSLRLWVSGSAPLSPALAGRLAERLGEPPLERYGSTETGLSVSQLIGGPRTPGTVGFPLPGLELAIADPERGERLPDGEDGEILLRGPQVFGGYWRNPEATDEAFRPGGWFRTGDVGRVHPEDGLSITGRLKEMIVSGGLNVYPREVELVLEAHPDVARAAVVGVPSERWGEEVVGVVEGRVEADALIGFARERLSAYKCPKRVLTVEALPVGDTGKVRRSELVDLVESRHEEG
jgi:malonyl-CoA/methylmalonyl-CoA synthetase